MRHLVLALLLAAPPSPTTQPTPIATPTPVVFSAPPFVCVPRGLCYPAVFLTSAITDWYDSSDTGSAIVRLHQFDKLGVVIGGHATTSMAAIIQWHVGDDVAVDGEHYTVFGATEAICGQPFAPPPARLYLLTSITNDPCASGRHIDLVVMAR
jgi:hypothetical protein